jgi:Leucine-rich repeat (LRR) protein
MSKDAKLAMKAEVESLREIFENCGGLNWSHKVGWRSLVNSAEGYVEGKLHGVAFHPDGLVKAIDLSSNNLNGKISKSLGNLSHLEVLILCQNQLKQTVPESLSKLKSCKILDLSRNYFVNQVPRGFNGSSLVSLETLNLCENKFSYICWDKVASISSLRVLNLSKNNLNGEVSRHMAQLQGLEFLDFSHNSFAGDLPSWIGEGLTNLQHLNLSVNSFSGQIPTSFGNLKKLRFFSICDNDITGALSEALVREWPFLVELNVAENELSGPFPAALGQLRSLQVLELQSNQFNSTLPLSVLCLIGERRLDLSSDGQGGQREGYCHTRIDKNRHFQLPEDIGTLAARLNSLVLSGVGLSSTIPPGTGMLSALTSLDFSRNALEGSIPDELGNPLLGRNLVRLDLSDNKLSGSLPVSFSCLSHLTYLDLSKNQLSGEVPVEWRMMSGLLTPFGTRGLLTPNAPSGSPRTADDLYTGTDTNTAGGGPEWNGEEDAERGGRVPTLLLYGNAFFARSDLQAQCGSTSNTVWIPRDAYEFSQAVSIFYKCHALQYAGQGRFWDKKEIAEEEAEEETLVLHGEEIRIDDLRRLNFQVGVAENLSVTPALMYWLGDRTAELLAGVRTSQRLSFLCIEGHPLSYATVLSLSECVLACPQLLSLRVGAGLGLDFDLSQTPAPAPEHVTTASTTASASASASVSASAYVSTAARTAAPGGPWWAVSANILATSPWLTERVVANLLLGRPALLFCASVGEILKPIPPEEHEEVPSGAGEGQREEFSSSSSSSSSSSGAMEKARELKDAVRKSAKSAARLLLQAFSRAFLEEDDTSKWAHALTAHYSRLWLHLLQFRFRSMDTDAGTTSPSPTLKSESPQKQPGSSLPAFSEFELRALLKKLHCLVEEFRESLAFVRADGGYVQSAGLGAGVSTDEATSPGAVRAIDVCHPRVRYYLLPLVSWFGRYYVSARDAFPLYMSPRCLVFKAEDIKRRDAHGRFERVAVKLVPSQLRWAREVRAHSTRSLREIVEDGGASSLDELSVTAGADTYAALAGSTRESCGRSTRRGGGHVLAVHRVHHSALATSVWAALDDPREVLAEEAIGATALSAVLRLMHSRDRFHEDEESVDFESVGEERAGKHPSSAGGGADSGWARAPMPGRVPYAGGFIAQQEAKSFHCVVSPLGSSDIDNISTASFISLAHIREPDMSALPHRREELANENGSASAGTCTGVGGGFEGFELKLAPLREIGVPLAVTLPEGGSGGGGMGITTTAAYTAAHSRAAQKTHVRPLVALVGLDIARALRQMHQEVGIFSGHHFSFSLFVFFSFVFFSFFSLLLHHAKFPTIELIQRSKDQNQKRFFGFPANSLFLVRSHFNLGPHHPPFILSTLFRDSCTAPSPFTQSFASVRNSVLATVTHAPRCHVTALHVLARIEKRAYSAWRAAGRPRRRQC